MEKGGTRMGKQKQSRRTEISDTSHVEYLLGLLRDLSPRDPSPALRERLRDLASRRLQVSDDAYQKRSFWWRPVLAAVLLVAVGLTAAWIMHLRRQESLLTRSRSQDNRAQMSSAKNVHNAPAVPVAEVSTSEPPKTHRVRPKHESNAGSRRMVLRLPYSNNDVSSGTDA